VYWPRDSVACRAVDRMTGTVNQPWHDGLQPPPFELPVLYSVWQCSARVVCQEGYFGLCRVRNERDGAGNDDGEVPRHRVRVVRLASLPGSGLVGVDSVGVVCACGQYEPVSLC
jgi:hypothetical protein